MDLLRALEMSRLQYLRDTGLLHEPDGQKDSEPSSSPQLQKAAGTGRPRANSSGAERRKRPAGMTPMEELDMELQRVLELSSSIPQCSSQGEASTSKADQTGKSSSRHKRKFSQSRFDESTSTVVTRVPNKSVEDLYCLDCGPKGKGTGYSSSTSSHSELSPGVERHQAQLSPGPDRPSTSSDCGVFSSASVSPDGAGCLWLEEQQQDLPTSDLQPVEHGMFGTIKDLSVSNIHSADTDKTSQFLSKDLHSLFQSGKLQSSPSPEPGSSSLAMTDSTNNSNRLLRKSKTSSGGEDGSALLSSRSPFSSSSPGSTVSFSDAELDPCLPMPPATTPSDSQDCAFLPSPPTHEPVPCWQQQHQQPQALLAKTYNTSPAKQPTSAKGKTRTPVASQDGNKISSSSMPEATAHVASSHSEAESVAPLRPDQDDEHVSLLEMAEHLLQMTAEMHSHIHSSSNTADLSDFAVDKDECGGGGTGYIGGLDTLPGPLFDMSAEVSSDQHLDSSEEASRQRLPLLKPGRKLAEEIEEKSIVKTPLLPVEDTAGNAESMGAEDDVVIDATEHEEGSESDTAACDERPSFFV